MDPFSICKFQIGDRFLTKPTTPKTPFELAVSQVRDLPADPKTEVEREVLITARTLKQVDPRLSPSIDIRYTIVDTSLGSVYSTSVPEADLENFFIKL